MTRCPECSKACTESDFFCLHCGARLRTIQQKLWHREDWLNPKHLLRALVASAFVFAVRLMVHPLLLLFQGERHEGRIALFHITLGMAFGLAVPLIRKDFGRWYLWFLAGLLGGILNWALDFAYMADHLISQGVFYVLNWLDSSVNSNVISIGFGILQILRFLGLVLVLGLMAGWKARRGIQARIIAFSLLALALRGPVIGYNLSPELFRLYWHDSALYLTSLFLFFYGLGPLDSNSVK